MSRWSYAAVRCLPIRRPSAYQPTHDRILIDWGDGTTCSLFDELPETPKCSEFSEIDGIELVCHRYEHKKDRSQSAPRKETVISIQGPVVWGNPLEHTFRQCDIHDRNDDQLDGRLDGVGDLLEVISYGDVQLKEGAFMGAYQLSRLPSNEVPDSTDLTSTAWLFAGATSLNSPIALETPNTTSMQGMFACAGIFNSSITLDTSNVTDFSYFLFKADHFNQPLTLDTTSAVTMKSMFEQASAFNQPLSFNLSKTKEISRMFSSAFLFDQLHAVKKWCPKTLNEQGWISPFNLRRVFDGTSLEEPQLQEIVEAWQQCTSRP